MEKFPEGIVLETVCLSSDVEIHCVKFPVNPYTVNIKDTFLIQADGQVKPFLKTTNEKLFNHVKLGALEVFSKIFENYEPQDFTVGQLPILFQSDSFTELISDRLETLNISPKQSFFMACMEYFGAGSSRDFTSEKMLSIINNHVKMFDDLTYIRPVDLKAIFDPYYSQLGFDDYLFSRGAKIAQKNIDTFLAEPEMLKTFKRYVLAMDMSTKGFDNIVFSDLSIEYLYSPLDNFSDILSSFNKLPLHHKEFFKAFNLLTVADVRMVFDSVPYDCPSDVAVELLHHSLYNFKEANSVNAVTDAHELYCKIFDKFISKIKNPRRLPFIVTSIMEEFTASRGLREAFTDYIDDHDGKGVSEIYEIEDYITVLCQKSANSTWCVQPNFYADYVLMKLHEKIGGHNAVNIIFNVSADDSSMTVEQWMNFVDRYDELKDTPVSWWRSLV